MTMRQPAPPTIRNYMGAMMIEHESDTTLPTWNEVKDYPAFWQLYQRLIGDVPTGIGVRRVVVGCHWTYVEADCGIGVSMTVRGGRGNCRLSGPAAGMELRDLAALSTSWSFLEASIGVAALNAWHASPDVAHGNGMRDEEGNQDSFEVYRQLIEGKRVAIVGHFPLIERLGDICKLSILERAPQPGDLPDPACEYIISEQDYLFCTGITLQNKTLPRLLQLAREGDTPVIMVGPSVVPSPVFFDFGVVCLAGSVCPPQRVDDVKLAIEQASDASIFAHGLQKMRIEKPGWQPRN